MITLIQKTKYKKQEINSKTLKQKQFGSANEWIEQLSQQR